MSVPPKYSLRKKADSCMQALIRCIQDSNLRCGDKLPPQRELAVKLGVSSFTVYKALHGLEQEGILEIRDKVGVFVATGDIGGKVGRTIGITTVCVESHPSSYYAFMTLMIQDELFRHGCHTILFPRKAKYDKMLTDTLQAFPGLEDSISRGWIDALLDLSGMISSMREQVRSKGIPCTYCGPELPVESGLFIGMTGYLESALTELIGLGAERIALLCPRSDDAEPGWKELYREKTAGLSIPDGFESFYTSWNIYDGRKFAEKVLNLPKELRPDGWLIYDEYIGDDFLEGLKYLDPAGSYHPHVVTTRTRQLSNSVCFDGMIVYEKDLAEFASLAASRILEIARGGKTPDFQYVNLKRIGPVNFLKTGTRKSLGKKL